MHYTHECRTTFANGVNPFFAASGFMPEFKPAMKRRAKTCITRADIFAFLADKKPRTIQEVAAEMKAPESIGETLAKMAKSGLIGKRPRQIPRKRSVPEYFVWG